MVALLFTSRNEEKDMTEHHVILPNQWYPHRPIDNHNNRVNVESDGIQVNLDYSDMYVNL